jgi:hypothetical protein
MPKFTVFIFLLFALQVQGQYTGGGNDGFQSASALNQNTLPNIYAGGANDGFSLASVTNQNTLPNIYAGDSNDGFDAASVANQNTLPNIYAGGVNDGFQSASVLNQNTLPNIYGGGQNDGFNITSVINQNTLPNIYTGGQNDGYDSKKVFGQNPLCSGTNVAWNGTVSTAWENPANWDCGVLPNAGSTVVLPSGMPRYPVVSFSYEIKSLDMLPGSLITLATGINFIINSQ